MNMKKGNDVGLCSQKSPNQERTQTMNKKHEGVLIAVRAALLEMTRSPSTHRAVNAIHLLRRIDEFLADVPKGLSEVIKFHPEMDELIVKAGQHASRSNERTG